MKKVLFTFSILSLAGFAWAIPQVWRSSFTNTADTTKNLCGNDNGIVTNRRGILHSVCVSSNTAGTDVITVYNSSASAINPIAVIDGSSSENCYTFDVIATTVTKGLTYSKTGTSSVEILYDCYQ